MDRLLAMQTFARVAELQSFSLAAQSLNLPNASVSTRVSQLEEHLGIKLLTRTTRHIRLTDEGAVYLEWVQRLLAEIGEVEDQLRGHRLQPQGRLRVDVPASAGRNVIAPALPSFLAQYPDITIDLGCTDRPVDLIAEGVDCVIRGGRVTDETLVARRLGIFDVMTCAAPGYLKHYGVPQSPHDLTQHKAVNFFSAKTGKVMPLDFLIDGSFQTVKVQHSVGTNDADTYMALALQGLGIAQFPRSQLVQEAIAAGKLVPILQAWQPSSFPLYVVYPRNRHLNARVRVFVDWVVDLYRQVFEESRSP